MSDQWGFLDTRAVDDVIEYWKCNDGRSAGTTPRVDSEPSHAGEPPNKHVRHPRIVPRHYNRSLQSAILRD